MDSVSSRDIKLYTGYSISNRNQSQKKRKGQLATKWWFTEGPFGPQRNR